MERLCGFKKNALSVLGFLRSTSAPDEATLKEEAHALQCTTAGSYNAIPADLLRVGSMCGLGVDVLGIHSLSLAARYRTTANSGTLANGHVKIHTAREYDRAPMYALSPEWKEKFFIPRWHLAPCRPLNLRVAWIVQAKLLTLPAIRNKKAATIFCSATKSKNGTLPNLLLHVSPEPSDLLVDSLLHRFCLKCVMRHELAPG